MHIKKNKLSNFHIIYLGIFIIPFQYLIVSRDIFTILIIGISLLSMLSLIRKEITLPFTYFNIGYMLLIIFGLISTFYTRDTTSSYSILIEIIPYYFYCLVLSWYILDNPKESYNRIVRALKVFLTSTLILAIYTLINDLSGFNIYTRIGSEMFGDKHTMFTYYLMISICIAVWLYYKQSSKIKKISCGIIIIILFMISVSTAIRKAIFIPIIFWIAYVFMNSLNKKKLVNGMLKIIVAVTFLFVIYTLLMNNDYFASTVGRRMEGFIAGIKGTGESDNSFNVRKQLVVTAIESFKEYPIFGYGFGAFRDYADNIINVRLYAHNNYLELLASTGIIGFSIYYGFIILMLRKLYNRFKYHKHTIFTLGIGFIISLLANDFAVVSYLSLPYMVMLSIISCICKIKIDTSIENLKVGMNLK